jgi:lysophospholipase L1-like esterase
MNSRPKTRLRSKLTLALTVTLLGLLLLEGLVRLRAVFLYGTPASAITEVLLEHDDGLNMPVPIKGKSLVAKRISIEINSLGFRSDEIEREKPAGTIRIACLGGSTTFCAEVSSNQATWPQRLGDLLQARHPGLKIEVINAAIPGCSLAGSFENLRQRVLPLDPDIVIVYHAHNDMKLDTRRLASAQGLVEPGDEHRGGMLSSLGRYSLLADLLQKNLSIVYAKDEGPSATLKSLPADLTARFVGLLGEMHALLAERDVDLVLSTFVAKIRPEQTREEQLANAGLSLFYMPWLSVDQLVGGLDLYNRAILDFGRENAVPVLADTSIPPDSKHYVDGIHMTDSGCERMAERFCAHIEALGLIERRAGVREH